MAIELAAALFWPAVVSIQAAANARYTSHAEPYSIPEMLDCQGEFAGDWDSVSILLEELWIMTQFQKTMKPFSA